MKWPYFPHCTVTLRSTAPRHTDYVICHTTRKHQHVMVRSLRGKKYTATLNFIIKHIYTWLCTMKLVIYQKDIPYNKLFLQLPSFYEIALKLSDVNIYWIYFITNYFYSSKFLRNCNEIEWCEYLHVQILWIQY